MLLCAGGTEELQTQAAECLSEILAKRMDAQAKLRLVHTLAIVPICAAWRDAIPGADAGSEVAPALARLVNTLACEVIESLKRIENHVISLRALGVAVDSESEGDVAGISDLAAGMLDALMPAVLRTLRYDDTAICLAAGPFLNSYTVRLRNMQKREGALTAESVQCLGCIIQVRSWSRTPEVVLMCGNMAKLRAIQVSSWSRTPGLAWY